MAEFSLAVLGLPANILAISLIGRYFARKIRIYRQAPDVLVELRDFGVEIYRKQFYLDLKLAQAYGTDFNDPALNNQLDSLLKRFKVGLNEAHMILAKSYNDKGEIDKARVTLSLAEELKEVLEKLRLWRGEFYVLMNTSLDVLRSEHQSMVLTYKTFLPSITDGAGYCKPVSGTSHAYFGHAEWQRINDRKYTPILFEKHDVGPRILDEVLETLLYLALHLPRHPFPDTGILRCLGYRNQPGPELIFEIPRAYSRPQTLRRFLERGSDNGSRRISKSEQLRFAYQISTAIFNTQEVGLIHKNVRPDSILVFGESSSMEGSSSGRLTWTPFLTNWTLARTEDMLSYRQGDDDWQRNLYRHPQRQGLQVEERYHSGHDIYSLGVCLLEIGLGESLIVLDEEDEPSLSELFQNEVIKLQLLAAENANRSCRSLKPRDWAKVLCNLSKTELGTRMGQEYSAIVQQCLECIEQGFDTIHNFQNQVNKVSTVFQNVVLHPLEKLSGEVESEMRQD